MQTAGPGARPGPTSSVVVVINHGLAAIAEFIFLLDHRGAVGRLALPDDRGAVAIAVPLTYSWDCPTVTPAPTGPT